MDRVINYMALRMTGGYFRKTGFTLVYVLVDVPIIGVLATVVKVAVWPALKKSRDAKRKFELSQIGRFFTGGTCYVPDAGPGDYDLGAVFGEVLAKNPQYAKMISKAPRDPKGGTETETLYRYAVTEDGRKCALYANLENRNEPVTITGAAAPTPGTGTGVLQAAAPGVHGTTLFFQVSN